MVGSADAGMALDDLQRRVVALERQRVEADLVANARITRLEVDFHVLRERCSTLNETVVALLAERGCGEKEGTGR